MYVLSVHSIGVRCKQGSFAVSRLGFVRNAPTREQRRHISEALNKERYRARAAAGIRALEISRRSIDPTAGDETFARAAFKRLVMA